MDLIKENEIVKKILNPIFLPNLNIEFLGTIS